MKRLLGFIFAAAAMSLSLGAVADEGSTMRAVRVQTADVGAYVEQLKEGNKLIHSVDERFTLRVWQATFAGESTGSVVVAIVYPGSFGEFATAWEKVAGDPAVKAWLDGLSAIRTIVSDSIYTEHPL